MSTVPPGSLLPEGSWWIIKLTYTHNPSTSPWGVSRICTENHSINKKLIACFLIINQIVFIVQIFFLFSTELNMQVLFIIAIGNGELKY